MKPVENLLLIFGMFISLLVLSIANAASLPEQSSEIYSETLSSSQESLELANAHRLIEREARWVSDHDGCLLTLQVHTRVKDYRKIRRFIDEGKPNRAIRLLNSISTKDRIVLPIDILILSEYYTYLRNYEKVFHLLFLLQQFPVHVNQNTWLYAYNLLERLGEKDLSIFFEPFLPENDPQDIFELIEAFTL